MCIKRPISLYERSPQWIATQRIEQSTRISARKDLQSCWIIYLQKYWINNLESTLHCSPHIEIRRFSSVYTGNSGLRSQITVMYVLSAKSQTAGAQAVRHLTGIKNISLVRPLPSYDCLYVCTTEHTRLCGWTQLTNTSCLQWNLLLLHLIRRTSMENESC